MVVGPAVRTVSGAQPLDEVLSGRLGADAVRTLALRPLDSGLAPLLEECLPRGPAWHLRLVRSKYKPDRKLTAYYTATTHGRAPDERQLAVAWQCADTDVSPEPPGTSSGGQICVLVHPADPAMPALARLSDGEYLASLAASLDDPGAHAAGLLRVRVLRYRPGQRHVLHAVDDAARRGLFVKTGRDDSGARAVRVAQDHGPALARRCAWAGLARPLGYSAADRASLWHEASGEPLWQVLATRASPDALVARVGTALRVLHDTDLDDAALPRCRDAGEQVALTLRAGEHITALLPSVGRTYDDLANGLAERLDRLPHGSPALAHGDLKCDHVLVDGDRLRVIDLDRAGRGDPALDLGALLADLRWWYPDRAGRFAVALRAGYGPCESARWTRARTLASLFLLRFAARRCAVHDPEWEPKVRAGVAAALASVQERGLR